jgi:hypothetical protein
MSVEEVLPAGGDEEEEQVSKRPKLEDKQEEEQEGATEIHVEDIDVEEITGQIKALVERLSEGGYRAVVLDGDVLHLTLNGERSLPADGLVDCLGSDCVLIVPPGPRYIMASAGGSRTLSDALGRLERR